MRYYRTRRKVIARSTLFYSLLILTFGIFITNQKNNIKDYSKMTLLTESLPDSDAFRAMQLSDASLEWLVKVSEEEGILFSSLLTVAMLDEDLVLLNIPKTDYSKQNYLERRERWAAKEAALQLLEGSYAAIWDDLKYFPVPVSTENAEAVVTYSDTWMYERTYGGKRGHEGTDLMAAVNERGYYPIVSMTDGVIENVGWLEKGGWRIGIRSKSGAYFYYAHLAEYGPGIEEGKEIAAGEFLGWMGDSGYGEEGMVGQFDVHLHLGVYISTPASAEISVNPYWILKYLEDNKLEYSY